MLGQPRYDTCRVPATTSSGARIRCSALRTSRAGRSRRRRERARSAGASAAATEARRHAAHPLRRRLDRVRFRRPPTTRRSGRSRRARSRRSIPSSVFEPLVAAAPGYSSYQSRVLVDRFAPFAPDWVVFYVGAHNDERRRVVLRGRGNSRARRSAPGRVAPAANAAGGRVPDRPARPLGGEAEWAGRSGPGAFRPRRSRRIMTRDDRQPRAARVRGRCCWCRRSPTRSWKRYPGTPIYHEILRRVAAEQRRSRAWSYSPSLLRTT